MLKESIGVMIHIAIIAILPLVLAWVLADRYAYRAFLTICPESQEKYSNRDFAEWLNAYGGIPEDQKKYPELCKKFVAYKRQIQREDAILVLKKAGQ